MLKVDEREAQRTPVKNTAIKCNWINATCHPLLPAEPLPHLLGFDFTFKLSYQSSSSRFHIFEMQINKAKNRWQEKGEEECEVPLLLLSITMLILTRLCLLDWLLGSNPSFLSFWWGKERVKNASNKLSLSAPPVFQCLLHPRRFRVMREKQIAVITLLDVKTELPRYPWFGLGIGNITPPHCKLFCFWEGSKSPVDSLAMGEEMEA